MLQRELIPKTFKKNRYFVKASEERRIAREESKRRYKKNRRRYDD